LSLCFTTEHGSHFGRANLTNRIALSIRQYGNDLGNGKAGTRSLFPFPRCQRERGTRDRRRRKIAVEPNGFVNAFPACGERALVLRILRRNERYEYVDTSRRQEDASRYHILLPRTRRREIRRLTKSRDFRRQEVGQAPIQFRDDPGIAMAARHIDEESAAGEKRRKEERS